MARNYMLGNRIVFDVLKREVITEDNVVSIGGREAVILKLLCDNVNEVVRKEYMQENVWGNVFVSETSLTKAISNLRKSLAQCDNLACEIKTISKEGYILILDESVSGVFFQEEQPTLEVKQPTLDVKQPTLDVKSVRNSSKEHLRNIVSPSCEMETNSLVSANIPIRNMYFLLVCFSSAFLADILTTVGVMILNRFS